MKILVLVLSSNSLTHFVNRQFQKTTWGKDSRLQIIYYLGGKKKNELIGNKLFLDSSKKYKDIPIKTLDALEWCFENLEFDILFRTNASTYIDVDKLIHFVESNRINYAGSAGVEVIDNKKIEFGSGSGYFLSRNVLESVIKNKSKWNLNLPDDVGLAVLLKKLKIKNVSFYKNELIGFPLFKDINFDLFQTRCKLDHVNLPRIFEGVMMLFLSNYYKRYKKGIYTNRVLEKLLFYFFKAIQKFYPKKFFN